MFQSLFFFTSGEWNLRKDLSKNEAFQIAPSGLIYVNVFVRKQKAPLFELSLKLRQPPMDFVEEIERETASSSSIAIDDSFVSSKFRILFPYRLFLHQAPTNVDDFEPESRKGYFEYSFVSWAFFQKYQLLMDPLFNFHYKSYWDYLMKSLAPRVNFASFFGCNDEEFTSICSNLAVPFENMGVVMEQVSDSAMFVFISWYHCQNE